MKKITYIFSGNRKKNYESNSIQAKEFYYGLTSFAEENKTVDIIEFSHNNKNHKWLLTFIDKVLNKFFSLPFYMSRLVSSKNYKKLKKTDELFLVNESVGCSALPLLIMLKIFSKTNISLFVMGLYSKKIKYSSMKRAHFLIIKILVFFVDNVIFLGKAEMERASSIHKKNKKKFTYIPFSTDTEFWKNNENLDLSKNEKIIFVGNDGNRDFDLVLNLISIMKDQKFIVVSSSNKFNTLDNPNVELFKGFWGCEDLSDEHLKNLYSSSRLTLIPLKESYQPSGQSVALQSMSLGIPVLITNTSGFWDREEFLENQNIFFIEDNNPNKWASKISLISNNQNLLQKVAKNAKNTVTRNYGLDSFYNKLLKLIKV